MKLGLTPWAAGILVLSVASGCASMFMKGGTLVKAGYQPKSVLVEYRAEGAVPAGVTYLLVETEKGPALFERSADGSGTLMQMHWEDEKGDHFAGWVATGPGYDFVVPKDRSATASRYFYPRGTFSAQEVDGVLRLVPAGPVSPVASLIPIER